MQSERLKELLDVAYTAYIHEDRIEDETEAEIRGVLANRNAEEVLAEQPA